MPLAAVFNGTNQAFGCDPTSGAALTKAVSPAAGIVSSALTGDSRAVGASTCSVLGTGQNADLVTHTAEAV